MEYAAGGSIRNLMKSGTLDEECIKIVTRSVLEALIYLHKTVKIIHRDIKVFLRVGVNCFEYLILRHVTHTRQRIF